MAVLTRTLCLGLGCLAVLAGCAEDPDSTGSASPGLYADGGGSVSVGDAGGGIFDAGQWAIADAGTTVVDSGLVITSDGGKGCGSVKQASEALKPAVDVVWILDGSGSMAPHAFAVGDNMLRFMENVRKSGADINVVMLTGVAFGLILQTAIPDMNYHW